MSKKKVLVINYYRSKGKNTSGVREITDTIEKGGGQADVIHHSEAQRRVKSGEDILEGYDSFHATGSDINWTERTDKDSTQYMDPGQNELAEYLINHVKSGKFDCGSGQAAYHALGQRKGKGTKGEKQGTDYRVRNTGKFNRKVINGYKHNHKYGMDAKGIKEGDLEGKIRNITTFEHEGKEYVSSFEYGNKKIMQYHPGRTEKGKEDIRTFHELKTKAAAGGYLESKDLYKK